MPILRAATHKSLVRDRAIDVLAHKNLHLGNKFRMVWLGSSGFYRYAGAMQHQPTRLGPADYTVALAMNLLWGLNIVATKVCVTATAPFMAGSIRLAAVGLICLPWLKPPRGRAGKLALLGLLNGGLFVIFMNFALSVATNVGALAIAGQLSVPISVVLGVAILGERLNRAQVGGLVMAFGGVALLVFDPRIVNELPGLLLMVVAASCWAASTLLQRQLAGTPVLTMYAWTGVMGFALLLPLSLVSEPQAPARVLHLAWGPIAWFAFSVLGSTLLGQGGMAWLLRRHAMSMVTPLVMLSAVVSVAASRLYFGTPVTLLMVVGGIATLVGIIVVTLFAASPVPVPPIES